MIDGDGGGALEALLACWRTKAKTVMLVATNRKQLPPAGVGQRISQNAVRATKVNRSSGPPAKRDAFRNTFVKPSDAGKMPRRPNSSRCRSGPLDSLAGGGAKERVCNGVGLRIGKLELTDNSLYSILRAGGAAFRTCAPSTCASNGWPAIPTRGRRREDVAPG